MHLRVEGDVGAFVGCWTLDKNAPSHARRCLTFVGPRAKGARANRDCLASTSDSRLALIHSSPGPMPTRRPRDCWRRRDVPPLALNNLSSSPHSIANPITRDYRDTPRRPDKRQHSTFARCGASTPGRRRDPRAPDLELLRQQSWPTAPREAASRPPSRL